VPPATPVATNVVCALPMSTLTRLLSPADAVPVGLLRREPLEVNPLAGARFRLRNHRLHLGECALHGGRKRLGRGRDGTIAARRPVAS
jgi:hypothetical protein